MHINFQGKPVKQAEIRAGFIGCGSHSFRNIYPTFQFAPVDLTAVCDLDVAKAQAFARQFGAHRTYSDHREMLAAEELDAVFIVTGYDDHGRPTYPDLTVDCLRAGCHVWTEKPPAATCAEVETMQFAAKAAGRNVLIGMKKMFLPANEKAKQLMSEEEFGTPSMAMLQYPLYVPTADEFDAYLCDRRSNAVVGFLDHLCHPISLLLYLLGMPESLYYERSSTGAGLAIFRYASGAVASVALTHGASLNGGMERTVIISDSRKHITIDNNLRVTYHRDSDSRPYGQSPDFYVDGTHETSLVWEPEFSLGQLYNKGLFLLGYYNEVNEFAGSILEERPPAKGTLEQAWQVTRVFDAFAEGPGKVTSLISRRT